MTACGEMVIAHKITLEKAQIDGKIAGNNLGIIKKINISQYHPLGNIYQNEQILTINDLLLRLTNSNVTVFLFVSDSSSKMFELLKNVMTGNKLFVNRIIITSESPILIYKLRKFNPELICALWTKKTLQYLKSFTLITSIFGSIVRNIVSPVIGIRFIFVSKDEFNL